VTKSRPEPAYNLAYFELKKQNCGKATDVLEKKTQWYSQVFGSDEHRDSVGRRPQRGPGDPMGSEARPQKPDINT